MKKLLHALCLVILVFSLLLTISSCEEETVIQHVSEGDSVLYLLGNTSGSQMMGFVLKTKNNNTIVIDGGTEANAEYLEDFISEKSDDHVDAWFFTHPHHDHIGAFNEIFSESSSISVDKIYHHFPSMNELMEHGYRKETEKELWESTEKIFDEKFSSKVEKIHTEDVFVIDNIKITVLRVYDPMMTTDFVNNSSVVYRIENENKSFLILGDLGVLGGEELIKNCPPELLHTDYTQMAHHGQGGVSKEFYEHIEPKRCIWPTPPWLWNNDAGEGFDTGPWQTVRTREWMDELGITEHYVAKDGTIAIHF